MQAQNRLQIRMPTASLSIGTLAKHAGVAIDTIRYYEREGLIAAPPRRASGYRAYPESTVTRLRFIRRAKALGFSLADISELLGLSRRRDIAGVKRTAEVRLADVEQRIAELRRVRNGLRSLIKECPGHGKAEQCPILEALGHPERGEGG